MPQDRGSGSVSMKLPPTAIQHLAVRLRGSQTRPVLDRWGYRFVSTSLYFYNLSYKSLPARISVSGRYHLDICLKFSHSESQADEKTIMESAKVGKRGSIIVPARLRTRFGIEEGTTVTAEEREDGILIRPAVVVPVEKYTPARKAEFLLSNATTTADYKKARKQVQKLGIDPDSVPHHRPA